MSRIDGSTSVAEIADSTGVGREEVVRVLSLLFEANAAEWAPREEKSSEKPRDKPQRLAESSASVVRTKPLPSGVPRSLYDPQELEEPDVDLDVERRRTILDTYYRLDELDFYDVLGIETDAPKAEVRSAYFRLSKVFHPDTMFGKNLGSYKSKMEAVFRRLTEAYEVLGKKRTRQEYDNYILLKRRTRDAQRSVERASREAERIEREAARLTEAEADQPRPSDAGKRRPAPAARSDHPNDAGDSVRPPAPTPPDVDRTRVEKTSVFPAAPEASPLTGSRPAVPSAPPSDVFARPSSGTGTSSAVPSEPVRPTTPSERTAKGKAQARELMARKLAAAAGRALPGTGQSQRVGPRSSTPARSKSDGAPTGEHGAIDRGKLLKGLAGSLKQAASHTGGVDKSTLYVEQAREAEAEGNLVSAVNALRLAVALSGEAPAVVAEYDRVRHLHATEMAEAYEKQATYEARMGRFAEAALSWSKVCEGRPNDGRAHLKAAQALLDGDGDLSQAKRYAEMAQKLLAADPEVHKTLGRVFQAAGMKLNARREYEAVLQLAPDDDEAKKLLKDL